MSNRTAVIALAVITSCVSIFGITSSANAAPAASDDATQAANECLAAPKATTPKGAHWYYRVEKGTKRKCWYLADEVAKTKKAAAPAPASSDAAERNVSPPTQIAPEPKQQAAKKPMQKSVADARAELTAGAPQTAGTPEDDPALAETTWPPLTPSDRAAVQDDNQTAAIQPVPEAATTQGWSIASRWPEPAAAASTGDQTAATTPASPAPALTPERLATAAAPAPAASPAAVTPGAAAQQPQAATDAADTSGTPLRIILSVLVCVLALVAIVGPMLFKSFRPRRREDRIDSQRRPIWDMNVSGRTILQDNPPPELAPRHPHSLPEPRMLDEATDEIEELLARASKRSAA